MWLEALVESLPVASDDGERVLERSIIALKEASMSVIARNIKRQDYLSRK